MSRREPYRPSNGTEGEGFIGAWCERCARDSAGNCSILARSLAFGIDDPDYPKEWVRVDGKPECTAFVPLGELSERAKRAWATRRAKRNAAFAGTLFALLLATVAHAAPAPRTDARVFSVPSRDALFVLSHPRHPAR